MSVISAILGGAGGSAGTPGSGTVTSVNVAMTGYSSSGAVTAAGTVTMTRNGGDAFPENTYIEFEESLSADGKFTGIAIPGVAGAALAFGEVCYLAAADSRWELADADAASTSGDVQLAICVLAAAADGDPTRMLLFGTIRADAKFPALTVGAPVYVSTTPGAVQVAQPSGTDDVVRRLGFALTADSFMFNPSNDYITHT